MGDNQIGLQAIFDNADFQKGISDYNSSVSDATANTESGASTMSRVWDGLVSVGAAAWSALGVAVGAFTTELGLAANAAFDSEEVFARSSFIIAGVGERTGVTIDEVNALTDSLSKVVPIDDEVITSAITMGLTFDGVNKDNIQPLIAAAADLATFTGKDLPGTMRELALAISDPDRAMRLLKDANITLTDSEMKTLKGFKDVGDTAGATQFLLNELKDKGVIGLAEAMGDTAKGRLTIMQTALGNLQEVLGGGLLDSFKNVFDIVTNFANSPATIDFFTNLGQTIGSLANYFIAVVQDGDVLNDWLSHLPSAIQPVIKAIGEFVAALVDGIPKAFSWLINNKPLIVGILAAIGVAMAAFASTVIASAVSAIAALAPIIAAMVVIGAVAGLLFKAWTEDWGGIQGKVAAFWEQVKPIFQQLQDWLKVNIPKATKVLSDFWQKTLLPAIKKVVVWIVDNVLPALVKLWQWEAENLPKAIKKLSDFWTNVLLPALKQVGDWIANTLIPILEDIWGWLSENLPKAIQTLSDFWTNGLLPAIRAVSDFFTNTLIPTFQKIVGFIVGAFISALTTLSGIWTTILLPAIQAVHAFIQNFIMPIFNAVSNLMTAVVGLAVKVLAGIWQNFLLPALQKVHEFIGFIASGFNTVSNVMSGALQTATKVISDLWKNVLLPAIQAVWDKLKPFADFLKNTLQKAFDGIKSAIQFVVDKINALADSINNLSLPDWLTPGSPTPFEMGLRGINAQMDKLANAALPTLKRQLEIVASVRDVPGTNGRSLAASVSNSNQSTRNYLYGANFNLPGPSGLIESLQNL